MVNFKKVYFNHSDKVDIEAAFRKSAIKRDGFGQLEFSTSNIGTDKRFFGYENKKGLYFMRIKNSIEVFLPNIIFSLPKDETSLYYAFRLSTLAMILFFLFCFGLIFSLSRVIRGDIPFESFITIFIFFLLFLGLIWLELRITSYRIKKAIMKQQNASA
ncbi:MAG: hypothetical protein JWP94_1548 [Mucilaginibacter sp.]|jgi:ABC-type multidrug transport system fused ATPase/permease subunit|nr:hypothetical protein [Mucilaginibacter sp.]